MSAEQGQRRLAAILAADVAGYSRLVAADEGATLREFKDHLTEFIEPTLADHNGRIFKTMGDGLLAQFDSVVEAVECAVAMQRGMAGRNKGVEADRRIEFRIGVNLGDVIVEGGDVFGDGVNVAARLEGLAAPGEVCISRAARDQIRDKLDYGLEDWGDVEVKNIPRPVRVFRVLTAATDAGKNVNRAASQSSAWRPVLVGGAIFAVVAVAGAAWWTPWNQPAVSPQSTPAPVLASDKPSIAVLPFQNMSNDTDQDYFADGIAEDVITDLSKIDGVFVIARNSSFQYRGGALDLADVGRKLGVRYILEGSVRRAGDQVRINAQLIDTSTGGHVWAERFDGSMANVFSAQDKVTGQIISALKLKLTPAERTAMDARGTDKPAAYDAYLRGLVLLSERRLYDQDANTKAQAEFEKAIDIDPDYALAIAGLAWAKWLYHSTIRNTARPDKIFALAEKSVALSDNALARRVLSKQHFTLHGFYWGLLSRNVTLATTELEKAHALQPNDPDVLAELATVLSFNGEPDRALDLMKQAMKLNPDHPDWYLSASGIAKMVTGDAKDAVNDLRSWSNVDPGWHEPYLFLAAALGLAGQTDQAKAALERYQTQFVQGSSTSLYAASKRWPMAPEQQEYFLRGLRLAGIKETADQ